tara:strand:+ start:269 stop:463 length:195 start_codon:yes stop_codon:yes gene_type:complete
MKLTFNNGYEVSIIDKNEYILVPEVGISPPFILRTVYDMQVERFHTADELTDILIKVKNYDTTR